MILGIFGLQGEGKTATLTEWLYNHYKAGWLPVCNFFTTFPAKQAKFEDIKLADAQGIPLSSLYQSDHVALAIDEIFRWIPARTPTAEANLIVASLFSQLAKQGISLAYTAQLARMPDVLLREQTNYIIESEKVSVKIDGSRYILGFDQTLTEVKDGSQDDRFWSVQQANPYFQMYLRKQAINKLKK